MTNFVTKDGVTVGKALKRSKGTVTGNATLDLSSGNSFELTPTDNVTIVFSNPPATNKGYDFTLKITGELIDNSYDLANAQPPAYGRFSVASQETDSSGVFFKPDGTKMYVVGRSGDDVNEYDLSTAWEIATASYVQNFSVSAQEANPRDLFFKSDGTKMYIVGENGVDINEYSLSIAWDISTASYTQNFSVSSQDFFPVGLFFKSDGTKMYITGAIADAVYEYDLSTAWNISTASYVQSFSVAAQDADPSAVFFKDDGTKMYVLGQNGHDVNEYSLSSAWDISTALYVQNFSVSAQTTNIEGLFFKPDGLRMYIVSSGGDAVYSYTLTSAWDISSASFDFPTTGYFSVAAQETELTELFFKPDGTKMYVLGATGDDINEYDLSTAWEVSSASYVQNFSVSAQETIPTGLFFKPDGTKMYITGISGDDINEYSLSSAWDISTASYVQNFSVSAQETDPRQVFFKPDGTKMYVLGATGDDINEYDLSSAWDISTASYVQNFSVSAQDTGPRGLFFTADGTKFFIAGSGSGGGVKEYSLSSAWDISTASYVRAYVTSSEIVTPVGVFFGDNGTKMYVAGTTNAIWQYTTGTYGDATFTYPASVKWPSGTPPTAPGDGEVDILRFITQDGGTTYYGVKLGDDMS
jgi:6-phosphogluconolactonase (cycloisomerase 2 family)